MPRFRSFPPHLEIRRSIYDWRRRLPQSLRKKRLCRKNSVLVASQLRTENIKISGN
jgi:hypothetical protein